MLLFTLRIKQSPCIAKHKVLTKHDRLIIYLQQLQLNQTGLLVYNCSTGQQLQERLQLSNTVSKSKTCLKWPFWRMQRDNDATDAQQASWSSLAQSVLQFLRDVWGCRDQSCLFYTVACWCTLCGQSGFIAVVSYDFVLCNTWWLFNFNFFHTQCTLSGLCDKQ